MVDLGFSPAGIFRWHSTADDFLYTKLAYMQYCLSLHRLIHHSYPHGRCFHGQAGVYIYIYITNYILSQLLNIPQQTNHNKLIIYHAVLYDSFLYSNVNDLKCV